MQTRYIKGARGCYRNKRDYCVKYQKRIYDVVSCKKKKMFHPLKSEKQYLRLNANRDTRRNYSDRLFEGFNLLSQGDGDGDE